MKLLVYFFLLVLIDLWRQYDENLPLYVSDVDLGFYVRSVISAIIIFLAVKLIWFTGRKNQQAHKDE